MTWVEDRFRSTPQAALEQVGGGRRVGPGLFHLWFFFFSISLGGFRKKKIRVLGDEQSSIFLYMMSSMQLLEINTLTAGLRVLLSV